jgi:hypothetical protein
MSSSSIYSLRSEIVVVRT